MGASASSFGRLILYPAIPRDLDVGETGQCRFRFLGACTIFVFYVIAQASALFPDLTLALESVAAYLAFSFVWGWMVAGQVGPRPVRLVLCAVLEHAVFALAFARGGSAMALLLWVPICTTMGYGLRFGVLYGALSAVLGSTMLGAALVSSPLWSSVPSIGAGIVVSVSLLPLYAIGFNSRMHRARLEAERLAAGYAKASQIDSLTGLFNRTGLESALGDALQTTGRAASLGALLYIDLDGFKAVNDTAGHDAGDRVLKEVAQRMRGAVRSADVVARMGGDEFAVVLHAIKDAADARRIAEAVLASIRDIRVADHPQLFVSASIGLTMLLPEMVSAAVAINAADKQMLTGKRTGKGRVSARDRIADPDGDTIRVDQHA